MTASRWSATWLGAGNGFFSPSVAIARLDLAHVDELTDFAWRIRTALAAAGNRRRQRGEEIDHIELFGPPHSAGRRQPQFRSLSGQGLRSLALRHRHGAKLACLVAAGKLRPGDIWRQESIIGSIFEGSVRLEGSQIIPRIHRHRVYHGRIESGASTPPIRWPHGPASMTTDAQDAIVIGGGVIGAACAASLSQAGWQVTILERGEFGRGCSHGNCGFICPSHVLPLAEPGAIGKHCGRWCRRTRRSPFGRAGIRGSGSGC